MSRQKGSTNRKTDELQAIADRLKVHPFEILCLIAGNDWKTLGLKPIKDWLPTPDGMPEKFDELSPIEIGDRLHAAKEACRYLYPQRKAVEHTTGEEGFRVILEDYTGKKAQVIDDPE
jgi:hypothetical protein